MKAVSRILRILSLSLFTLISACGDDDGFPTSSCGGPDNPCAPHVVALQVLPEPNVMAVDTTEQYQAIATLSDGSRKNVSQEVTWSIMDSNIAGINNTGKVTALAKGEVFVKASFIEGVANATPVTDSARLTVTDAALTQIAIEPNQAQILNGMTQVYQAFALYADGHIQEITADADWSSSQTDIAAITQVEREVLAQGNMAGITTIKASFAGLFDEASLVVTDATVVALKIAPINAIVPKGTGLAYQALVVLKNGELIDVTSASDWQTNHSNIAIVDAKGYLSALSEGETQISASLIYAGGQLTDATKVTVTQASVSQLLVSPVNGRFAAGTQGTYSATAYYTDGTVADVTRQSYWQSHADDIVAIIPQGPQAGDATAITAGYAQVSAVFAGMQAFADVEVTNAVLEHIQILPLDEHTPAGTSIRFQAKALFSDASVQEITHLGFWQSSQPTIATIGTNGGVAGIAKTKQAGVTEISIVYQGMSATTVLTVTDAQVIALQVSPRDLIKPVGTEGQYTAIAYFSDGRQQDVSQASYWRSDDPNIVMINAAGLEAGKAKAIGIGTAQVSAEYAGIKASSVVKDNTSANVTSAQLSELVITPASASIAAGYSKQFQLFAKFTDGHTQDVTSNAFWQSANTSIARIDRLGNAQGLVAGRVDIIATYLGMQLSADLTVTEAQLQSLVVTPVNVKLPRGYSQQLLATAQYSDGHSVDVSRDAVWSAASPEIVNIVASGLQAGYATGIEIGSSTVTAVFDGLQADANVTVTGAILTSVSLSPISVTVAAGNQQQYEFTGLFSDGEIKDLTRLADWQSLQLTIATIDRWGLAQTYIKGKADIQASYAGFKALATLNVTDAVVTELQITPPQITAPVGTEGRYTAIAYYSDGHSEDVTTQSSWLSSDRNVVEIIPLGGRAGTACAITAGHVEISATFAGKTGVANATVTDVILVELQVRPENASVPAGLSKDFHAIGLFSDGSHKDLSDLVFWRSNNTSIASIAKGGQAVGVSVGVANITAHYIGFEASASLAVTQAQLKSLQLSPLQMDLPLGTSAQFEATAFYTDNSSLVVNNLAMWTSVGRQIHIGNGDHGGLVTGLELGKASVTVSYDGMTQSAEVNVVAAILLELTITPLDKVIAAGLNVDYQAYAHFTDGKSYEWTHLVDWHSSHSEIARIDSFGKAYSKVSGKTTIKATYLGHYAETLLTVTEPEILRLEVTPAIASVPINGGNQYNARAYYSDNTNYDVTTAVTWSVADSTIASIDNSRFKEGIATGNAPGGTEIKARFSGVEAVAELTVTDMELLGIAVEPADSSIVKGLTQQFTAQAIYTGGIIQDVTELATWEIAKPTIATTSATGLVRGESVGSTPVFAYYIGNTGEAALGVVDNIPDALEVTPVDIEIPLGTKGRYMAMATFGHLQADVTKFATWASSNTDIVQIVTTGEDGGTGLAKAIGSTNISAQYNGLSDDVVTSVKHLQLVDFKVSPHTLEISLANSGQLTGTAIYDNGVNINVTQDAYWESNSSAVIVESGNELAGKVSGVYDDSQAFVTASYQGMQDGATIYVAPPKVVSLRITPSEVNVSVGSSIAIKVVAIFNNSDEQDYTQYVNYTAFEPDIATVHKGVIEGISEGSTSIMVEFDDVYTEVIVTVTL